LQLHGAAPPAEALGGDELGAAAAEGLVAQVAGPGVLAHGPGEDLHRLLRRVLVAHDPALALPVDLPDRVVLVVAVVLGHGALAPAHHARLVAEVPEDPPEDRG